MYCRLGAKLQSRKAEWKLQKRVTDICALKYIQAKKVFTFLSDMAKNAAILL